MVKTLQICVLHSQLFIKGSYKSHRLRCSSPLHKLPFPLVPRSRLPPPPPPAFIVRRTSSSRATTNLLTGLLSPGDAPYIEGFLAVVSLGSGGRSHWVFSVSGWK